MGFSKESASSNGLRDSKAPIPDAIEIRKTVQSIRGTVQNIFRSGAFITSDGKTIYYGVNEMTVPKRLLKGFRLGHITECEPKEIMPKDSKTGTRLNMFIIPPDSHRILTYNEGKLGGLEILLLHGLDSNNTPVAENLYIVAGYPIQAFVALARDRLKKYGVPTDVHSPKRIVNEALRDLAIEEGLGEKYAAVKKMKKEMQQTSQRS